MVFCLMLGTAGAWAEDVRRILVIYSNSRLVGGNADVEQGLSGVLSGSTTRRVEIYSEFLESEFADPSYEQTVTTYLRGKYARYRPDVIVAVARPSLGFVLRQRANLFPETPIVHAAVFKSTLASYPTLPPDVIGVAVEYDPAGTIEQALRWHPGARHALIVVGSTPRDVEWERQLKTITPQFESRVSIEFLSGLPTSELLARVAALGPDSIVFTPGYYQSGDTVRSTPRESAAAIARASTAPVYGFLNTFIGTGVVGGRSPSFVEMGTQAGQTVDRLLDGASPATLALPPLMPNRLRVDVRQAHRWKIADSDIPQDAVLHFKEPSFWEAYRTLTIAVACVILFQGFLIGALLLERRRRRKAELAVELQRSEIEHASRLAMAGELTASIAHEINQPLGAILASADAAEMILQARGERDEDLLRIVSRIRRDDLRASEVIRKLRALLARHDPEREPFDLGLLVNEVTKLLEAEADRRHMALQLGPVPSDSAVVGDSVQLQQVLLNLMLNAMDAMADMPPDRRTVAVEVARDAKTVIVSVRDRGPGIAADSLPKVFESFFSTKHRGMGLGLSIARTIVEAHGGRIDAGNGPVHGAVFRVELPAAATRPAAAVAA